MGEVRLSAWQILSGGSGTIPSVRVRPQGVRVGQVNKCALGCRAYDNRAFLRAWSVLLKLPSLLPASGQLQDRKRR
jgi:hypothetical protein